MGSFFEHQAQARRNTRWLLFAMAGAVVTTGAGLYVLAAGLQLLFASRTHFGYERELWHPRLFLGCLLATTLTVLCASAFRLLSLRGGGARVAEMIGGRLVSGQARDALERRLLNVVEEMSIASGLPVPQVFVLDKERGINAFAAGYSHDDAALGITRGALEKLTRDELQGVIAHEFSHVLNGDMRLNMRLMGAVYGILCLAMCGRVLMRVSHSGRRSMSSRKERPEAYLFVLGLGLFLVGCVGELLGKLIKAAVSRQREFLADASAVQFTRNPLGVTGALKKIGGYEQGATVLAPAAVEASHFFFCDLYERLFAHSWLATHPPLCERIERLDPSFRGEFPALAEGIAEPVHERAAFTAARPRFAGGAEAIELPHEPVALGECAMPEAAISGKGGFSLPSSPASAAAGHVALADTIVAQVGSAEASAIEYGQRQLAGLPANLRSAAENPFAACALVHGLLLDGSHERAQLAQVSALSGAALAAETARWAAPVRALRRGEQLALVELAAPSLRQLSAEQRMQFSRTLDALMQTDRRVSIFEHVVGSMLRERIQGEHDAQARSRVRHRRLSSVNSSLELVLSALAHAGDSDGSAAAIGFERGATRLPGATLRLLPVSERLVSALGPALEELRALAPELKQQVVDACAQAALSDRRVSADELTLLRAICDALRCPLPLSAWEAA